MICNNSLSGFNRPAVILPPLDIAEVDDVPFDYSGYVRDDEKVVGVDIIVTVESGVPDPDAQNLLEGVPVIGRYADPRHFVADPDGRVALQRFNAVGRSWETVYHVRGVASLDSGRVLTASANITINRL